MSWVAFLGALVALGGTAGAYFGLGVSRVALGVVVVSYVLGAAAASFSATHGFAEFMRGWLIANLNPIDTAFNMGNFSFVDYQSSSWHIEHEAGHALNLAAFGSLFHLIWALDENATRRWANAYSERIAESNISGTGGSNIPMWA